MIPNNIQSQIEEIRHKCKEIKPRVAISSLAYNHQPFIKDTLDGFVNQKTDFPFVAIVHDDASTDKTAEILKEYAEKYPDIILPLYETENQYSKGDGILSKIMETAIEATGAEYIALCEGDDYWIDPLKLQKQINYLDSHPDISMCFHNVMVIKEKADNEIASPFAHLKEKDYSAEEIILKWSVPTCSAIVTKEVFLNQPSNHRFTIGDNVLWLTACRFGKLHCINEKMAVYRRQITGWTSRSFNLYIKDMFQHYDALKESFPEYNNIRLFDQKIFDSIPSWVFYSFKGGLQTTREFWTYGNKYFGKSFLLILIRSVFTKVKSKLSK